MSTKSELTETQEELLADLKKMRSDAAAFAARLRIRGGDTLDQRFISIGITDLQTGFMAIERGITRPAIF